MKLIFLLTMVFCWQASAKVLAQQITLKEKNAPLEKVFDEIKKQTHYIFFYDSNLLNNAKTVSIDVNKANLTDVLNECLNKTALTYTIVENIVVIKKKERSTIGALADELDIHVLVVDSLGNPLQGATVDIQEVDAKGNRLSRTMQAPQPGDAETPANVQPMQYANYFSFNGITDNAGKLDFENAGPGRYKIIITYIGYVKYEKFINLKEVSIRVRAALRPNTSQLDQVHVIAYGSQSKRFEIGATNTVTAKEIEKQPVTNVLLALQGHVPGLVVNPTSGAPGAAVQLQVRGQNSLASSTSLSNNPFDQPLFILDGVPMAAQNSNINLMNSVGGGNINGGQTILSGTNYSGMSPLNSLNPQDIESITILKDADATSIYGSQGINGVVLINTKKGKPGVTTVSLEANSGINFNTRPVKMLNTQQYIEYRREAFQNDGIIPEDSPESAIDLLVFDQSKYTDWFKVFNGGHAVTTNVHGTVSGGSNSSNYLFSGGYTNAGFNFPGNYVNKRLTMHSSYHQGSANSKFNLDFSTDYAYGMNNSGGEPSVASAILLPPNAPEQLDTNGNPAWQYQGYDISNLQRFAYLKKTSSLQSYSLNNSLRLSYQFSDRLNLSANLGYGRFTTDENVQSPKASRPPQLATSDASFGNTSFQTINIEPQLNYKRNFGRGELSVLLGGTFKDNTQTNRLVSGYDYPNDSFLNSIVSAQTIRVEQDVYSPYKYAAGFGRIGYIYNKEFLINLTGRRDGSSNFGPGRKFGNFGSAGLGWIFSERGGLKNLLPSISYGKITVNYGTSGSDGIAAYQYQAFWQVIPNYQVDFQGFVPYQPVNLYNPDYGWASKKSLNASLNLGFLADRILLTVNWYQNRTGNQLTGNTLPIQTGFASVLGNLNATVRNSGWEVQINSNNIRTAKFSWNTTFNISANKNELLAFPGLETSAYASLYQIGLPVTTVLGLNYKGVNPATGVFEFYDINGDVIVEPDFLPASQGGDLKPIVDLAPKFFGGLGNTISYKGISLYLYLQFSKQKGLNYLGALYGRGATPGMMTNIPVQALNHWRNPGDIADMQRLTTGADFSAFLPSFYFPFSTGAYSDASYIRLKTLSLGYDLPQGIVHKMGLKNLKIYANGQNLLTFTSYQVGDPENPGGLFNFPLQRTIVFGLNVNL